MPVQGVPAFNAITILDIDTISFASTDIPLVAHAAFINTETGATYGETTWRRWGKDTMDKLAELRSAMELDVAGGVFKSNSTSGPLSKAPPIGIGEQATGGMEAEQV
jgi:hypothetical protein